LEKDLFDCCGVIKRFSRSIIGDSFDEFWLKVSLFYRGNPRDGKGTDNLLA